MTIIDKIKQSVEVLGLSFAYGSLDDLNDIISSHDFDGGKLCYCTLISTGTAVLDTSGRWHDSVQIGLFVVDKTDFDPCSLENEQIIDDCKQAVFRWLISVNHSTDIKVQGIISSQRVYDQFDDIVTGYGVQITLQEKQGYGTCDFV